MLSGTQQPAGKNRTVPPSLHQINTAPLDKAARLLDPLVENSPELVRAALSQRPYASVAALESALIGTVRGLSPDEQTALFRRHPALAGQEALAGTMTAASQSEQGRLGLDRLSSGDLRRLADLNARYERRFGHPFIIALIGVRSFDDLMATFERRLTADPNEEHSETLDQIARVIRSRLARTFNTTAGTTGGTTKTPPESNIPAMEKDT